MMVRRHQLLLLHQMLIVRQLDVSVTLAVGKTTSSLSILIIRILLPLVRSRLTVDICTVLLVLLLPACVQRYDRFGIGYGGFVVNQVHSLHVLYVVLVVVFRSRILLLVYEEHLLVALCGIWRLGIIILRFVTLLF